MKLSWLLFLPLLVVVAVEQPETSDRKGKFLSMFNIVRFKNNKCSKESGVCFTEAECTTFKGKTVGDCASGFGKCCVISRTCGGQCKQKITYFTNPSGVGHTDSTAQASCQYSLHVENPADTQIRMDFLDFDLSPPTRGVCQDDEFTFNSPQNIGISSVCGVNNGQHLYIQASATTQVFSVRTSGGRDYKWNVKITQVTYKDDPDWFAPNGCAQYFPTATGTIESFNFNSGKGHYFRNLDYSICIKRDVATCRTRFTASRENFRLRGKHFLYGAAKTENFCTNDVLGDYLQFPGVTDDNRRARSVFRVCSDRLSFKNLGKTDYVTHFGTGPIFLKFHTDDRYDRKKEKGFRMVYKQDSKNCNPSKRN